MREKILAFLESTDCPVVDAGEICFAVFRESYGSLSPSYRKVLAELRKLQRQKLVESTWFPATNQRVWWLVSRLK